MGKKPIFGICLGHQLLGLASGGKIFKLKFGHRGANQPVLDRRNNKVEITSQNHGFALEADSFTSNVEVTHVNLNDQTVEGIRHRDVPAFGVQYHPEASAGPHDSNYLFQEFCDLIGAGTGKQRRRFFLQSRTASSRTMASERTLILIKPDAMERRLAGRLIGRFEDKGLSIVGMKLLRVTPELSRKHYAEHVNKPFYPLVEKFIGSGPVIAMVLEGPEAVTVVRDARTDQRSAPPAGTIRGDFGSSRQMNLVHASDGPDAARREIEIYFEPSELFAQKAAIAPWLCSRTRRENKAPARPCRGLKRVRSMPHENPHERKPLTGLKVVSLAVNLPGPVAAARLRNLGADVTKIEPTDGDPLARGCLPWFEALHQNVTVLRLDLKDESQRDRVFALLTDDGFASHLVATRGA